MTAIVASRVASRIAQQRLIVAITLLAGLAAAFGGAAPGRTVLAAAFVCFCPGAAWVGWFRLVSAWDRVALTLGLSIAAAVVVAETLALAGAWNLELGYAILAGITLGGVVTSAFHTDSDH